MRRTRLGSSFFLGVDLVFYFGEDGRTHEKSRNKRQVDWGVVDVRQYRNVVGDHIARST